MTDRPGVPARELSDEELERQGVQAHAMRHWVFLHGTADQDPSGPAQAGTRCCASHSRPASVITRMSRSACSSEGCCR